MFWLSHIAVLVAGFVIGVLFTRRNQKKVEKALDELRVRYENLRSGG